MIIQNVVYAKKAPVEQKKGKRRLFDDKDTNSEDGADHDNHPKSLNIG